MNYKAMILTLIFTYMTPQYVFSGKKNAFNNFKPKPVFH